MKKIKKKILIISPRFHTNLVPIIYSLKRKYIINLIVSNFGNTESHKVLKPILCKELKFSILIRKIFNLSKHDFLIPNLIFLFSLINEIKPDAIIIRTHNRFFYYSISLIGKILNSKIIFYDQLNLDLTELKMNNLTNIIKNFEFKLREFLFQSIRITPINFSKVKQIKNSFYLPFCFFLKKTIFKPKKILNIITVSKYHHRKNLLLLCKAALILKNKGYKFKILLVGEKKTPDQVIEFKKINKFLKESELLNKYVFLAKNIKYDDMSKIYRKGDIFVLPATREPGSISVLEAMSYGLPIVVSQNCGTRCYIKRNFNGRFFKDNNLRSIVKEIEFFFVNHNQIKVYRDRSIKLFKKLYTTEIFLANFDVLFKRLFDND